jgi:hypothetical protein
VVVGFYFDEGDAVAPAPHASASLHQKAFAIIGRPDMGHTDARIGYKASKDASLVIADEFVTTRGFHPFDDCQYLGFGPNQNLPPSYQTFLVSEKIRHQAEWLCRQPLDGWVPIFDLHQSGATDRALHPIHNEKLCHCVLLDILSFLQQWHAGKSRLRGNRISCFPTTLVVLQEISTALCSINLAAIKQRRTRYFSRPNTSAENPARRDR